MPSDLDTIRRLVGEVTAEQPRVRAFLTVLFDDGRICFTTAAAEKAGR